ncbi:MAG: tRNA pseudouridine(55) synthase TruB [Thermoguttaceae bacterium]
MSPIESLNLSRQGGLIPLNKPTGMTSRQVVNRVERLTRPLKAGHAGTLDPLASGVLVVCIGPATRLIEYVQRMRKQYVGAFLLGRQSPTEDIEGEVVELPDATQPTLEQTETAVRHFVGRILQRPPAFSALKIQGRPAYRLARQGRPVELQPRPVEIHRIAVQSYQYPELILEVECGAGTYIRSLGRDLAERLGTAAVMTALRRTAIGQFCIESSIELDKLTVDGWTRYVESPLRAVEGLPQIQLTSDEVARIRNGQTIARRDVEAAEIAALDPDGQLVGILEPAPDGRWRTRRNMPTP